MKIIFDFDGTLVDSMPRLRKIATDIFQDYFGFSPVFADKNYMRTTGRSFAEQLDLLDPGREHSGVVKDFQSESRKIYDTVDLHRGVVETIQFLNDAGIDYALCTSTYADDTGTILDRLLPEFTQVALSRDWGPKFAQLKELTKDCDLKKCWFIGDTPFDFNLSRRLRTNFVGVSHTFSQDNFPKAAPTLQDSVPSAIEEVLRITGAVHSVLGPTGEYRWILRETA